MSLKYTTYYDYQIAFISHRVYNTCHRINGPSVIWKDGDMFWYHCGKLHRLDGPAILIKDDSGYYYIDDVEYTKEKYESKISSHV